MDVKKKNSIILIFYLYMGVLFNLLSPILTNKQISNINYIVTILLIIYALFLNDFQMPKQCIVLLLAMSLYMVTNLLFVQYKYFVLVEIFIIFTSCILPLYIITIGDIRYKEFLEVWYKITKILTFMFPVFVILYLKSFIKYSDIGHYSHLNSLILMYYIFVLRDLKLGNILCLVINITMGLIMGSRMLFAASIGTGIAMTLFISKKKDYKYYIRVFVVTVMIIAVMLNIKVILNYLQSIMTEYGLSSRNITLFIAQIEGGDISTISSGRDKIYEVVIDYIKDRSGRPGGLAVTRYITEGKYYYSHNIFLDFILLLGTKGTILFIIWFIYRNYKFFKVRKYNYYRYVLYFMLMVSFLIRSIAGSYFVRDKFFLLAFSILVSSNFLKESVGNAK